MNRATVAKIGVGVAGTLLTYLIAPPGRYVLEVGAIRFDPSLAVIAAFAFLAVWGAAMSLRQSAAFQSWLDTIGFNPTVAAVILGLSLFAGVLAFVQTDATGSALITNVVVNVILTMIGMTGVFVLFRHFGWWYPGNRNNV